MISENQCENERKEIVSSLSDNRNFMPSSLQLKSSEQKIIDVINNSEEKVSNDASPDIIRNDIQQYEKLETNTQQNLRLPLSRKNSKIYNDQITKNTEHAASSELHNDNWKIPTSKNGVILKLQENTSKEFEDKKSWLVNLQHTKHMYKEKEMIAQNTEGLSNVSIEMVRKTFLYNIMYYCYE